jgi:hypothetical protein
MALGTQFRLAYAGPATMTRRIIMPTGIAMLVERRKRRPVTPWNIVE